MPSKKQERNLARWIEALISGKYIQPRRNVATFRYQLYNSGTKCHCALGVALEAIHAIRIGEFYVMGWQPDVFGDWPVSKYSVPFDFFEKHFGIDVEPEKVSFMSDYGQSFAEIAVYLCGFLPDNPKYNFLSQKALRIAAEERIAHENLTRPCVEL